ncbi:hypothetical protein PHYBOEH_011484 [Phytophthora boehmeriae]|uniref:RxLR effector protein n=1 Tax=Phytophthora boehmeriae TaxID=109152 RepID=A0A8T1VLR7_9STRA|nr:hypothetical protein PHYBOEH_011484 [Phytophthora boehmeriae]
MRVHHVLWVLAATFAARCITTSTATSSNMIQLGGSVSHETTGNRFLRGDKKTKKEEDEAAAVDEERIISRIRERFTKMLNIFDPYGSLKTSTFDEMIADDLVKIKMFMKWDKSRVSLKKVEKRMDLVANPRHETILFEYTIRRAIRTKQRTPDEVMKDLKAIPPYRNASKRIKDVLENRATNAIDSALDSMRHY